jgi:hypothetical protein
MVVTYGIGVGSACWSAAALAPMATLEPRSALSTGVMSVIELVTPTLDRIPV